jgi:hypothetical protein
MAVGRKGGPACSDARASQWGLVTSLVVKPAEKPDKGQVWRDWTAGLLPALALVTLVPEIPESGELRSRRSVE